MAFVFKGLLLTCYGFQFCAFRGFLPIPMHVSTSACTSTSTCVSCLFSLPLFCPTQVCFYFTFSYYFSLSLDACFLIKETKKGLDLNGLEGGEEPEETEKGDHNQNVLHEKESIFNEETENKINFKIMQLTKTCRLQWSCNLIKQTKPKQNKTKHKKQLSGLPGSYN